VLKRWTAVLAGFVLLAVALFSPQQGAQAGVIGRAEVDDEAIARLKDDEWSRVRAMNALALTVDTPATVPPAVPLLFDQQLAASMTPDGEPFRRLVPVASSDELRAALRAAQPGDFILMADGVYRGEFEGRTSGTADARITLYGSRRAVIEGLSLETGYGFYLTGDYWTLDGFTVRGAGKGIVTDGANHNLLQRLEVYNIGDEGVHFRSASSDNLLRHSWVYNVGQVHPELGEASYIGSAYSNWSVYSGGQPDTSDRNQIIGNLFGPGITAEAVDAKEGTSGGRIAGNTIISDDTLVVDSWIDIKGNGYEVYDNAGMYDPRSSFRVDVDLVETLPGWSVDNVVRANVAYRLLTAERSPFRAFHADTDSVSLVLPARPLPYRLPELIARFPDVFERFAPDVLLLTAHLVAADGSHLRLDSDSASVLRLLGSAEGFSSIVGFSSQVTIVGSAERPLRIESWDAASQRPDGSMTDGRPYVYMAGGRMGIRHAVFADLGFTEGVVSGVAWKGLVLSEDRLEVSRGDVSNSQFLRSYFGAYTYQAVEMRWIDNIFANNHVYGFDPHDFSNDFLVEGNSAYENGSHGIIFSRGCSGNIIRNNESYNNRGHGIMIDDGKVIMLSPTPRYLFPVPSDRNVIEHNRVWNNHDGIIIEGGVGNIVRGNTIIGPHRYGIRLTDRAVDTVVENNTIEASDRYGIFIYERSSHNRIVRNRIIGGRGGIVVSNSAANIVEANIVEAIVGYGLRLKGSTGQTVVTDNHFAGRGSNAIRLNEANGIDAAAIMAQNDVSGWEFPPPALSKYIHYAALSVWIFIFGVPLIIRLRQRTQQRRTVGFQL
jgi:parallel beta-helix repeat protein